MGDLLERTRTMVGTKIIRDVAQNGVRKEVRDCVGKRLDGEGRYEKGRRVLGILRMAEARKGRRGGCRVRRRTGRGRSAGRRIAV